MGKRLTKDEDGKVILDGDRISFSYGIPPVKEYAQIKDEGGILYAHIEGDSKPSVISVRYLKQNVQIIYKENQNE